MFKSNRYFYAEIQSLTNTSHKLQCTNWNTPLEGDDVVNSIFCLDPQRHGQGKYRIRAGWKLHLYISQLPCKLSDAFISFFSCINTELPLFVVSLSFFLVGGDASIYSQLSPLHTSLKEGVSPSLRSKFDRSDESFEASTSMNSNGGPYFYAWLKQN